MIMSITGSLETHGYCDYLDTGNLWVPVQPNHPKKKIKKIKSYEPSL